MTPSRRGKFEIWSEIMEFCLRKPRSQTWLLREVRLKTEKVKLTLDFLLSRHLIEEVKDESITKYHTTEKGKEALLQYYNLINDFFNLK